MSLLRRIERGGQAEEESGNESKLAQIRNRTKVPQVPGAPGAPASANNYQDLKVRVQNKLLAELDTTSVDPHSPEVRTAIEEAVRGNPGRGEHCPRAESVSACSKRSWPDPGLWSAGTLLADDTLTEVMVNGPRMSRGARRQHHPVECDLRRRGSCAARAGPYRGTVGSPYRRTRRPLTPACRMARA